MGVAFSRLIFRGAIGGDRVRWGTIVQSSRPFHHGIWSMKPKRTDATLLSDESNARLSLPVRELYERIVVNDNGERKKNEKK